MNELHKAVNDAKRRAACKNETRYVVAFRGGFSVKTKVSVADKVLFVCDPGKEVRAA